MYHRKGYFGSETSAWIFGFFKKVLHVLSLSNLVTLGRPTKIKTKKNIFQFFKQNFVAWYRWHPMDLNKMEATKPSRIFRGIIRTKFRWKTLQRAPMTSWLTSFFGDCQLRFTARVTRLGSIPNRNGKSANILSAKKNFELSTLC